MFADRPTASPLPDEVLAFLRTMIASVVRDEVRAAVEAALSGALPDAVRKSQLPPYLTRGELARMTGWSVRKVDYLREKRRLPYIRRGRTVLFRTADVEEYLMEGYVPARAVSSRTG